MTKISKIYVSLILKNIKTIDDVPEHLKPDVLALLNEVEQ